MFFQELDNLRPHLQKVIEKHGIGGIISQHEILGVMYEEFDELREEVHKNNFAGIESELKDLAIGAIYGLMSLRVLGKFDKKEREEVDPNETN